MILITGKLFPGGDFLEFATRGLPSPASKFKTSSSLLSGCERREEPDEISLLPSSSEM